MWENGALIAQFFSPYKKGEKAISTRVSKQTKFKFTMKDYSGKEMDSCSPEITIKEVD